MDRRRFISLTGAAGIGGVAGCLDRPSVDDEDDSTGDSTDESGGADASTDQSDGNIDDNDPEALVETIYREQARCNGLYERYRHSAVSERSGFELIDIETAVIERDLDSAFLHERLPRVSEEAAQSIAAESETATVEADITYQIQSQEQEESGRLALATDDAGWRILGEVYGDDSRSGHNGPQVAFDFEYDKEAGTVSIVHDGGDAIEAGNVRILGEGIASGSTGTVSDLDGNDFDADDRITAGVTIEIEVTGSYRIQIVWGDDDEAVTLATTSGPDE